MKNKPWGVVLAALLLGVLLLASGCAKKHISPAPARPAQAAVAPKGTYKPYKVYGEKYYPITSAHGYEEKGVASWYGSDFHGKKTACGEVYNMHAMTAAHKILPMHTKIRVTNLENGKSAVLRVNDRGPFVDNRIVDLSYAGAKALDMVGPGTARVRLEALTRTDEPRTDMAELLARESYYVQVGSFQDKDNATRLIKTLKARGLAGSRVQDAVVRGARYWRVLAGVFHGLSSAEEARAGMEDEFPSCFILAD